MSPLVLSWETCKITELGSVDTGGRFLKLRCDANPYYRPVHHFYKCPNGLNLYGVILDANEDVYTGDSGHSSTGPCHSTLYKWRCPDDPAFFQACGHCRGSNLPRKTLTGVGVLCGSAVCDTGLKGEITSGRYVHTRECDGVRDCEVYDDEKCEEELVSGKGYPEN